MRLPNPRGPLSAAIITALTAGTAETTSLPVPAAVEDVLHDDDLQLALWTCYELHYRGFDEVPDDREWDTGVITFRRQLEAMFLAALRAEVPTEVVPAGGVVEALQRTAADDSGPSLSSYLQREADLAAFTDFVAQRSVYHLKEADPHTFAIPRLGGRPKAALVEIQADEYGGGTLTRMHATLFANMMTELGLDTTYGAYVDRVPGITLATNNLMSMFGLNRRWRGALVGHLAMLEMTSSLPMRRYGLGLRRLGGSEGACEFFDEHIEADAVHEQIAAHDLCGGLVEEEPQLASDVVFGAACAMRVEALFATRLHDAWLQGRSSLRTRQLTAA